MRPTQIAKLIVIMFCRDHRLGGSTAANFIIEYNWWKEVGQVDTWIGMLWYSIAPAAAGAVMAFYRTVGGSCLGAAFAASVGRTFAGTPV